MMIKENVISEKTNFRKKKIIVTLLSLIMSLMTQVLGFHFLIPVATATGMQMTPPLW